MSDGNTAAWAHVVLQGLEIIGGVGGMLGGLVVVLARRTFATRDDLARQFADHAHEHQELEQRLAAGENRFVALSGAIDMVKLAAEQAKAAADEARAAADRVGDLHIELAEMRGDIKAIDSALKPIERLTMNMVEGHMADGLKPRGRT